MHPLSPTRHAPGEASRWAGSAHGRSARRDWAFRPRPSARGMRCARRRPSLRCRTHAHDAQQRATAQTRPLPGCRLAMARPFRTAPGDDHESIPHRSRCRQPSQRVVQPPARRRHREAGAARVFVRAVGHRRSAALQPGRRREPGRIGQAAEGSRRRVPRVGVRHRRVQPLDSRCSQECDRPCLATIWS